MVMSRVIGYLAWKYQRQLRYWQILCATLQSTEKYAFSTVNRTVHEYKKALTRV